MSKKHTRSTPAHQPRSRSRFTRAQRRYFYENDFSRDETIERQLWRVALEQASRTEEASRRFAEALLKSWPKAGGEA